MSAFAQWLVGFFRTAVVWIWNAFIDCLQLINDALVSFLLMIVSIFPESVSSPTVGAAPVSDTFDIFLKTLNWLFPMSFLVTFVSFIVGGLLAYFVIAPLARWAKMLT